MTYINQIGTIYLNNTSGVVVNGGDPTVGGATPFSVYEGWTPTPAERSLVWQGGAPLGSAVALSYASYAPIVEEEVPIGLAGTSSNNAWWALQQLKRQLRAASRLAPIAWRFRPTGALLDTYAEVYGGDVVEAAREGVGPMEGGWQIEATIKLARSGFFGSASLETLISAASAGNRGSGSPSNLIALATLSQGDLVNEGQPLNLQIAKPASQAAATLYLATAHSRTAQTIASAKTTTSTTGTAFTSGSAIDVSAMRTRPGLAVRAFARLTTLTNPTKAQLQLTLQSPGGGTLWTGAWITLGSNTSAQLVDLLGTTLDAVRIPGSGALQVVPVATIRSTDGTSVTATLSTIDVVLAYTAGYLDGGAGLAAGQSYLVHAAQNFNGGGWLPLPAPIASVVDGTGQLVRRVAVRGDAPLAISGASLYIAWIDSGGAHTDTDTTTITAQQAPLYHTLRGLT
jgi:hypothetical protein